MKTWCCFEVRVVVFGRGGFVLVWEELLLCWWERGIEVVLFFLRRWYFYVLFVCVFASWGVVRSRCIDGVVRWFCCFFRLF